MKNEMKMWCLCRKRDGKPIKISCGPGWTNENEVYVIGFSTKKELLNVIDMVNDDEEIKRIVFKY